VLGLVVLMRRRCDRSAREITDSGRKEGAMRKFVVAAVAAVTLTASGQAVASTPATWVVDDDRKQCPRAEKTSINKAVKAARAGSMIQVCPGRYPESVTVDKPLTLKGDADAVDAVDCFDPAPSQPGDLDPAQQVIVDGGASSEQELFRLRADDIVLEGFVLQAASSVPLPTDFRLYRRAIDASDAYSGYRGRSQPHQVEHGGDPTRQRRRERVAVRSQLLAPERLGAGDRRACPHQRANRSQRDLQHADRRV
jgi:hypothetical protein